MTGALSGSAACRNAFRNLGNSMDPFSSVPTLNPATRLSH
jgi:hypothetical protein